MELTAHFDQALRRLNWVQFPSPSDSSSLPCPSSNECWLRACSELSLPELGTAELRAPAKACLNRAYLSREGRAHIQRLLSRGWTLRSGWPREWSPAVDAWLGRRLFFGHASQFAANRRLISLVSSRIGRHGNLQPDWPHWLDGALRYAHRQREHLLIVPETTLASMVEHFARIADLPCTTVRWTEHTSLSDWLYDLLSALASPGINAFNSECLPSDPLESIHISPPLESTDPSERSPQLRSIENSPQLNAHSGDLRTLPLQDRLSLALADSVLALHIRAARNLERLITQRLQDPLFPTGSVFVTLPAASSAHAWIRCGPQPKPTKAATDWLRRGAVGWIARQTSLAARSPLRHCRLSSPPVWLGAPLSLSSPYAPPLWQLSGPLPAHWQQLQADDDWPYLVHCTRGTLGPFPEESVESFRERVWLHEDAVALHPLETLSRICLERRLRATCGITRTDGPCVSFSAVPLVPLLRRRKFQIHLGRWDWEPYGLLIRHRRLLEAGAAQVVYGSHADFLKLPTEKKPLFQPSQRKRGRSQEASWTEEREWRVLHDVDLQSLAAGSILVFTRTRTEAQQLAQYSPWPVLWTELK